MSRRQSTFARRRRGKDFAYGTFSGPICENDLCYEGTISGYICGGQTASSENSLNNFHNLIKRTNPVTEESFDIVYKPEWRNKGIVRSVTDPLHRTATFTFNFAGGDFYNIDYDGRQYHRIINEQGKLSQLTRSGGSAKNTLSRRSNTPGGKRRSTTAPATSSTS